MAPLSIQSGVQYAKTLLPDTLLRSVSTVQTSLSRHILPAPRRRCYRVCTSSRRRRRVLEAASLDELLEQAASVFVLSCHLLALVLEEDGTVVDSEDFFLSLPSSTPLMVLEKGETWAQHKVFPSFRRTKRTGIAKVTFDLYKLHPKDFLCCLAVRATLCEMYSLAYDLRCTNIRHVLRLLLRGVTWLTRLSAQLLLHTSAALLQLTGDDD